MRWLLHIAGLVLLLFAAVLQFRWADFTEGWNALGFGLLGLACWCAAGLPAPTHTVVVRVPPARTP